MDCIYEETSSCADRQKGQKIYKILNIAFWLSLVFAAVCLISSLMNIPFEAPDLDASQEELTAYQFSQFLFFMSVVFTLFFGSIAVFAFVVQRQSSVSYDYIFVSGELRVAKIMNASRRKQLVCLQPEQFLQVGDVESEEYKRLESDLEIKTHMLTANTKPTKEKFFMYIYATDGGAKKLYVLECKEELLVNVIKFIGRSKLAKDYKRQT